MICNSCGFNNAANAVVCLGCGQDLVNPTIIQGKAVPVPAHVASLGSSGSANAVSVLIPLVSGVEDPTRAIQLPQGYFKFLVGRTDLGQRPPIKPQIDLEKLYPDLVMTSSGYIVSRQTGTLRRGLDPKQTGAPLGKPDPLNSNVFFSTHQKCGATVLVKGPLDTDSRVLKPGDEEIVESGTYLLIGSRNEYIEFIAR